MMHRLRFPYSRFGLVWIAAFVVASATTFPAVAQLPAAPPADSPNQPEPPGRVSPRPLGGEQLKEHPSVHLLEKDGTLVPVPGFSLEDFDTLIERQTARGPLRPKYTVSRLTATGKAGQESAEVLLEIQILVHTADWVRVPLRLGEAVLIHESYQGPGKYSLEFEGPAAGYSAWLQGENDQPHRLSLRVIAPVQRVTGRQRVRLTAPRSTQSELNLTVPLAPAEFEVLGGALLDRTLPPQIAGNATEVSLRALDGVFDLTWWPATQKMVETTADLEAVGALLARVDGRSVRTEATLTVRSSGGDYKFQKFRVRVPRTVTLAPTDQPGVKLVGPTGGAAARIVEVQLDNPTSGPVEVRLITQRMLTPGKQDEVVDLAGIEVLDAIRQSGHIAVQVADNWQVAWEKSPPTVRRVEVLPENLRLPDLAAGFEYAGATCSLPVRVDRRPTRVLVEPEYIVRIDSNRILLQGRFKYRLPGAKVYSLEIDFTGWVTDADRIGPASLVDQEQVSPQRVSPLVIPLTSGDLGPRQEFELLVDAWRPIPAGAEAIDFQMPLPKADYLGMAPVVVLPADNVAIVPQSESLVGLRPQPLLRKLNLPPHQQEPFFYLLDAVQGKYAAGFRVLPGSIAVTVGSEVTLDVHEGRVEQKFNYKIAREAVPYLSLAVPVQLADSTPLEVGLNGRAIPLVRITDEPATPDEPVLMRVNLIDEQGKLADRIGACNLVVRYAVPHEPLLPNASVPIQVPLVMPHEGTVAGNEVAVLARAGIKVQLPRLDGVWKASHVERLDPAPRLRFVATERTSNIGLVAQMETAQVDDARVERAWVQSQLGIDSRQDRAVYRFTSSRDQVELTMPRSASINGMQVLLNGQPIAPKLTGRILTVPIPRDAPRRSHVLELSYRYPNRPPRNGRLTLDAPQWEQGVSVWRLYWQIVLPQDEHLLAAPNDFSSEFAWTWKGFYLARQPLMEQSDLENWCGPPTAHRDSHLSGSNVYLFGSLEPGVQLNAWTSGRTGIVFATSLAVFAIGLLLLYMPVLRRAVLLVVTVSVAALGLIFPEPALFLLQAGSLGLALALFSGVLRRVVSRGPSCASGSVVRRPASSIVDRSPLAPALPPMVMSTPSSTRTAAVAAAPGGAVELEP